MGSHDDFDSGAAGGLDPYGERALDDRAARNLAALVSQPSPPESPDRPSSDDETVSVRGGALPPEPVGGAEPPPRSAGVASIRSDDPATSALRSTPAPEAVPPQGLRWSTVVHEPAPSPQPAPTAPAQPSFLDAGRGVAPPPVPAMPVHETRLTDALAGLAAQRWFWSTAVLVGAVTAMLAGFGVMRLWGPGSGGTITEGSLIEAGQDGAVADTVPQSPALSDTGSGLPGTVGGPVVAPGNGAGSPSTTAPAATVPTASTTALASTSSSTTTSTTVATTAASSTTSASTTSTTAVSTTDPSSTSTGSSTSSTTGSSSSTTDPSSTTTTTDGTSSTTGDTSSTTDPASTTTGSTTDSTGSNASTT